ncbi:MAG: hypothetical protein KDD01_01190 [Phaeodactylibacter sp.]|nr:hypothetical protein [Phaeodactylibacter sp.]
MTKEIRFESPWFGEMFRVYDGHVMIGEVPLFPPGAGHVMPSSFGGMTKVTDVSDNRIVHSDQSFDFHYDWCADSLFNALPLQLGAILPGLADPAAWEIRTMVEGMGPGLEAIVNTRFEPFIQGIGVAPWETRYNATVRIAPPAGGTWPTGVYDVVVTIQLVGYNAATNTVTARLPVAGFAELGKLQVYDA